MTGQPTRVVIVGRDAALWLTASVLQRALAPAGVAISAVELPSELGAASAYTSLPPLEALHAKLGLDETGLLRATHGSFSLGYNVVDPAGNAPFFLAHGSYGAPIEGGDFLPYWVKARRFGLDAALEDFCLTAMAARQGRMLLPDEATEAFGRTDYGYHLPAIGYVAMLKAAARRSGIAIHHAHDVDVERTPETGAIRAVRLDTAERLEGDLFIDASGVEAVLIGRSLGVEAEDWRHFFPADRRLIALGGGFASVPAYAELRIGMAGWLALHARQGGTHVVYAYSSAKEDAAALGEASALARMPLSNAIVAPIETGRRAAAWSDNCVAIGAAACAFDPLFDVELHAIQLGIVHLLALFPASADFAAERDEYNRISASAFERVRDFQSAFYALNRFGESGFWADARAAAPPETVAHKIATFRARGVVALMEDESFAPDLWQAMFVGLGAMPESWPPAIDRTSSERMKEEFRRILGFIKAKVLEQPTHDSYLRALCGSEAA